MLRPVFRFRGLLNGSFRGAGSRFLYLCRNSDRTRFFAAVFNYIQYREEIFAFVYVMGVANAGGIPVYLRKLKC